MIESSSHPVYRLQHKKIGTQDLALIQCYVSYNKGRWYVIDQAKMLQASKAEEPAFWAVRPVRIWSPKVRETLYMDANIRDRTISVWQVDAGLLSHVSLPLSYYVCTIHLLFMYYVSMLLSVYFHSASTEEELAKCSQYFSVIIALLIIYGIIGTTGLTTFTKTFLHNVSPVPVDKAKRKSYGFA